MTRDEAGEVAVRQNGQETAIGAPNLEGEIHVDLDAEQPHLHLPGGVDVTYWPEDENTEHEVATDGGAAKRREVEMRGFALDEEWAAVGMFLSVALLVGSGAFLSGDSSAAGLAMLGGGVLLGYVGVRSFWSGRTW